MARVTRRLVVLEDTLWVDERVHRAEKVRDATHVRQYTREEFLAMFAAAGLDVRAEATFPRRHDMDDWLSATGCAGECAAEVRRLLAHVAEPDGAAWTDTKWVAQAVKRAWRRPALRYEVEPHAVDVAEGAAGALDVGVALARHDEPLEAEAQAHPRVDDAPVAVQGVRAEAGGAHLGPAHRHVDHRPVHLGLGDLELVAARCRPRP